MKKEVVKFVELFLREEGREGKEREKEDKRWGEGQQMNYLQENSDDI